MESVDEVFHFLARKSSVITCTEEATRLTHKLSACGGIPTKVIQSCKTSPIGSLMNSSTCSSLNSSDSEEETVSKKRSTEKDTQTNIDKKVLKMAAQPETSGDVIRVTPLRPVCSVFMITHEQDDLLNKVAPEVPQIINEPFPGVPINLDNVEVPPIVTLEQKRAVFAKMANLTEIVHTDKYRAVWHSCSIDENDGQTKYTVPFTVDHTDFLAHSTQHVVPPNIKEKTYAYALQRAEKLEEFKCIWVKNRPIKKSRSESKIDLKRNRNDSRIVSTRKRRASSSSR